jgi:hypothetical protein
MTNSYAFNKQTKNTLCSRPFSSATSSSSAPTASSHSPLAQQNSPPIYGVAMRDKQRRSYNDEQTNRHTLDPSVVENAKTVNTQRR